MSNRKQELSNNVSACVLVEQTWDPGKKLHWLKKSSTKIHWSKLLGHWAVQLKQCQRPSNHYSHYIMDCIMYETGDPRVVTRSAGR